VKVIKRYSSDSIREIITYENNRPKSNIGFTELGDTIDYPTCTYVKTSDSLFVFIPINRFQKIDIYFRFDSTSAANGREPGLTMKDFRSSAMLPISPKMYKDTNLIAGAVYCYDSLIKMHKFFPFVTRTK